MHEFLVHVHPEIEGATGEAGVDDRRYRLVRMGLAFVGPLGLERNCQDGSPQVPPWVDVQSRAEHLASEYG